MPVPRKPPDRRQNHLTKDVQLEPVDPATAALVPVPDPPAGLLQHSAEVWHAFWHSDVSNAIDPRSDLHRLERWIFWVDQYERTRRAIEDMTRGKNKGVGLITQGSTGQPRLHPLTQYMQQCETNIAAAEKELGLTPRARTQLGIAINVLQQTARAILDDLEREDDLPLDDALEAAYRIATD